MTKSLFRSMQVANPCVLTPLFYAMLLRRRNVHQVHDFLTSFKGRAGRSMSRKDRRAAPQEEQYVEQEGFYDEMGNWYPADAFEQHFPPQPAAPQLTAVGRLAGV
jgi:hypothetical protein